jgi:DNA-binding YbaB/EbfC family protein
MNIKKMLRQAQEQQEKLQRDLEQMKVEGTAGGGMVVVQMNGSKHVSDIRLDPEVVDPEDVEMLQDLIVAAVADATQRVDEMVREKVGGMLGGMGGGIPGLGDLLG